MKKKKKVLIACEFSDTVRSAFASQGHTAFALQWGEA